MFVRKFYSYFDGMEQHEHFPVIESETLNCVLLMDDYQEVPAVVEYDYFKIGMVVTVTDFTYRFDEHTTTDKSTLDFMVKDFIELNHPAYKVYFEL